MPHRGRAMWTLTPSHALNRPTPVGGKNSWRPIVSLAQFFSCEKWKDPDAVALAPNVFQNAADAKIIELFAYPLDGGTESAHLEVGLFIQLLEREWARRVSQRDDKLPSGAPQSCSGCRVCNYYTQVSASGRLDDCDGCRRLAFSVGEKPPKCFACDHDLL